MSDLPNYFMLYSKTSVLTSSLSEIYYVSIIWSYFPRKISSEMRGQCSAFLTNISELRHSQLTTPLFLNTPVMGESLVTSTCCLATAPTWLPFWKRWRHVTNRHKRHPESKISPFRTPQITYGIVLCHFSAILFFFSRHRAMREQVACTWYFNVFLSWC